MNKPNLVLADLDANYLSPLEDKLTEELYDQVDLEIITDKEYFNLFFSSPRKIDTLIISENLYSQDLLRHNITNFYVLTEDSENTQTIDNVTCIFKYSSIKEIFNQILYKNKEMLNVQFAHKGTEVIVVTSAIGGAGKTTLSLALSKSLANNHKRVFYISTDIIQSFSFFLNNKGNLPTDVVRFFNSSDDAMYANIKAYFRNEGFMYLPPFNRSILSLGLDNTIYNKLITAAKESKDFDYIVIDTDLTLDKSKAEIMQNADKVIINVLQDLYSTFKTEYLLHNMDCRNSEKFIFVCNKFRRDIGNEYIGSEIGKQFIITEYIEELPLHSTDSLESFIELTSVRNLAYILS